MSNRVNVPEGLSFFRKPTRADRISLAVILILAVVTCPTQSAEVDKGLAEGKPFAKQEVRQLCVHDVGEYAAVPWGKPGSPISPGSRADRVRDLNLAVASINLPKEDPPASFLDSWAERAQWGRQQGKKFLPRVYFWDGSDRFTGPMHDIAVYWRRMDLFLGGMKSRGALDDFSGIVLAEENVHYGSRPAVLAELYRRIKAKYDVNVWQWWSPMTPVPGSGGWIPADGWVVDPYFVSNPTFRRYIRKYLVTGLPLVVMPWATAESKPLTPGQWQANNDQLNVAVEFNLPVAFYWTYRNGCSFGGDRGEPTTELDLINHWVWSYIKRTRALPVGYSGLQSADIGQGDALEIGPTGKTDNLIYVDDFTSSKCIDDASMSGFRDVLMDGKTLSARGFAGRKTDAALLYHFAGGFPARYPKVSLTADTDQSLNGRVEIALSADGKSWPRSVATSGKGAERLSLSPADDKCFASLGEFWVRLRLSGDAGSRKAPPVRISDLRIEAGVLTPKESFVQLKPDPAKPGMLFYEDDFQTQRYRFTTRHAGDAPLEWSRGSISVRMRPGGSSPAIIWYVKADKPLGNIIVDASGRANTGSLGTNHYLDVSTDDKTWTNEVSTVGGKHNVSGWTAHGLRIDLSGKRGFTGIREFHVRLSLRAPGYKEVHPSQSGHITKVRFEAETLKE